jgi:mono/diheme cytochrome c family protein
MEGKSNEFRATLPSLAVILTTVAVSLVGVLARAEPLAAADPNSVRGLVASNCSRCHLIPPYSKSGLKSLNAPPFFNDTATTEIYTIKRLRTFLQKPHYPMEPIILSARDIDNLVAFIQGMRGR